MHVVLQPVVDEGVDTEVRVPFDTIPGESVLFLGISEAPMAVEAASGVAANGGERTTWTLALSNFRLHISEQGKRPGLVLNVPLSCIETCELKEVFFLHISCRDGRFYKLQLDTDTMGQVRSAKQTNIFRACRFIICE